MCVYIHIYIYMCTYRQASCFSTCSCASSMTVKGFAHHLQLLAQQWPHGVIDGARGDQVAHLHRALLPQPVCPILRLARNKKQD